MNKTIDWYVQQLMGGWVSVAWFRIGLAGWNKTADNDERVTSGILHEHLNGLNLDNRLHYVGILG